MRARMPSVELLHVAVCSWSSFPNAFYHAERRPNFLRHRERRTFQPLHLAGPAAQARAVDIGKHDKGTVKWPRATSARRQSIRKVT